MTKHQIEKLSNGLRVVTRRMEDNDSVTIGFYVGAGGRYEDMTTEYGAAHFLEHLLFKGTTKRPSAKIIAEEVDSVGGLMNAYTTEDHTAYYIKLPKQHFALAFDILSDILTDPLFDPDEIERERGVILEEMNVYKDDPARFVFDLVGDLLWPEDTLRTNVIGTAEIITGMQRSTIADYYKSLYTVDNMVVSVAGNVEHADVVAAAQAKLGELQTKASRGYEHIKGGISDQRSNIVNQDTNQVHMVVCARGAILESEDEAPMRVMSAILGGGMSSRLFLNVRERKGLAYTIYSTGNGFVDSGKFEIYAGVNKDKAEQALVAIGEELKKIIDEPVPSAELQKAVEQVKGRMIMGLENNFSVADDMGTDLILTGKIWTLEQMLRKIDAVTAADVARVAQNYLAKDNLRLAMIGPFDDSAKAKYEKLITQ